MGGHRRCCKPATQPGLVLCGASFCARPRSLERCRELWAAGAGGAGGCQAGARGGAEEALAPGRSSAGRGRSRPARARRSALHPLLSLIHALPDGPRRHQAAALGGARCCHSQVLTQLEEETSRQRGRRPLQPHYKRCSFAVVLPWRQRRNMKEVRGGVSLAVSKEPPD